MERFASQEELTLTMGKRLLGKDDEVGSRLCRRVHREGVSKYSTVAAKMVCISLPRQTFPPPSLVATKSPPEQLCVLI